MLLDEIDLHDDDEILAFSSELAAEGKSPHTIWGYFRDLRHFARWYKETLGEPMRAQDVCAADVALYKSHLRGELRRAPATINRRIAALRMFFRWAEAEGLARGHPAARVRPVRESRPGPKSLDQRAAHRLLRTLQRSGSARDVALVALMLHAGLRVGEVCNLRLGDLTLRERSGAVRVRSGKGDRDRTVPLNSDVRHALRAYLAVRPKIDEDHVFLNSRYGAMGDDGVQFLVRRYGQQAGLEGLHPHLLRHTFAYDLVRRGVDLVTVKTLMGHENLATTARYTVPHAGDLEEAVDKLAMEW